MWVSVEINLSVVEFIVKQCAEGDIIDCKAK